MNLDISSEKVRADAIIKARRTRKIVITPRIQLVSDLTKGTKGGIVVFFPFYKNPNSETDDIDGLVIGAYELDGTIKNVTQNFEDKSGIGFDIIDMENNDPI